jgi:cell division septum initiation protein DivIVA
MEENEIEEYIKEIKRFKEENERLRQENEQLRQKLNEIMKYIEERRRAPTPPQQGINIDPNLLSAVLQSLPSLFSKPKQSEIESLLNSAEVLNKLKEYLRNPIEDELIRNSLELQKASLETQKTNLEIQKALMRGIMKQLGIEEKERKTVHIKIPPEAFEHE